MLRIRILSDWHHFWRAWIRPVSWILSMSTKCEAKFFFRKLNILSIEKYDTCDKDEQETTVGNWPCCEIQQIFSYFPTFVKPEVGSESRSGSTSKWKVGSGSATK